MIINFQKNILRNEKIFNSKAVENEKYPKGK